MNENQNRSSLYHSRSVNWFRPHQRYPDFLLKAKTFDYVTSLQILFHRSLFILRKPQNHTTNNHYTDMNVHLR